MKTQQIRAKLKLQKEGFRFGGWLGSDAKGTYLSFGMDDRCLGILDGQRLYRLAKAIVKRFEQDGEK